MAIYVHTTSRIITNTYQQTWASASLSIPVCHTAPHWQCWSANMT